MIAIQGGMNGVFLLLLILSIMVLILRPSSMSPVVWDKEMVAYLVAMAALPMATFLSQSYHQDYNAPPYDAASRFLLAVPILLLLRRVKFNVVAVVQYGFPTGAIVGLIVGLIEYDVTIYSRLRTSFLDAIHFGDFELILGVLSLLSINWISRDVFALRMLKIAGFLAGIYASYASSSRGGWLAIPVFLAIFYYFNVLKVSGKTLGVITLLVLTSVVSSYQFNQNIRQYIQGINYYIFNGPSDEIKEFYRGNPDTDTGVRLQLYKAAIQIFARNPLFGVGTEGFKDAMTPMQQSGELTASAAAVGRGEVHNEILSRTVGMGIFGLVAILLIFIVPLKIFIRRARSVTAQVRQSGILGITFVSGFFVFGLTVDILNLTMASAFYSFTVAVLLAASLNIHHAEQPPNSQIN